MCISLNSTLRTGLPRFPVAYTAIYHAMYLRLCAYDSNCFGTEIDQHPNGSLYRLTIREEGPETPLRYCRYSRLD